MSPDPGSSEGWHEDSAALWRILSARRDHRHFHPTPVPRETIERLLEVFAVAPSVGLSQPWHVAVIEGILQAPVGLVISHVPPAGPVLGTTSVPAATEYSVVAAITLLWLAVTAEGLGMGWDG